MDLTFIIRTYNEESFIPALLKSIFEQKTKYDFEVVVVDSESTDNTVAIIKEYKNVSTISIKKDQFTYGRSINEGLSIARGRYVCIVSAHCILCEQFYIDNVVSYLDSNLNISGIYGEHRPLVASRSSECVDFKNKFVFGIDNRYPNNANAIYRRELFKTSKFDESLIALEDMEFALRMRKAGHIFKYSDKIPVYHFHHEDNRQVFRRYFREHYVELQLAELNDLKLENKYLNIFKKLFQDCLLIINKGAFIKSIYGVLGYRLSEFLGVHMAMTLKINKTIPNYKLIIIESIYYPKPLCLDVD